MKQVYHRISIPSILETGPKTIEKVGTFLKREGFNRIVLFYGEGIRELVGERLEKSMQECNVSILQSNDVESMDFSDTSQAAFSIPAPTEAIVAVGGGKVLDAAKYMGFLRKMPFISIPTSTSNDGFSSPVSSVLINNRRTTVPARIPYGIIVDIDIVANAPTKFIYSGIGDLLSNITALYDWKFEEQNGRTRVDDFAVMISQKAANSFMDLGITDIKNGIFLNELVDSLIMNGIAMEISGDSAPASGSEHLISHALDKILENPYLHGVQVGIATYLMSLVQNNRTEDIKKVFESTGFFAFVKNLDIKADDFSKAIDLAPSIKPQRFTVIHNEENRKLAKDLIRTDNILKEILH